MLSVSMRLRKGVILAQSEVCVIEGLNYRSSTLLPIRTAGNLRQRQNGRGGVIQGIGVGLHGHGQSHDGQVKEVLLDVRFLS